ncbi:MAG: 16S rRNA (cytosine(1402)-N(4))-methyltransferase RsmH [Candidatus Zixiibacteriota bacterium]
MYHTPVMPEETAQLLLSFETEVVLDLTCGGGGHLKYFSDRLSKGATLIGIDRDIEAVTAAAKILKAAPQKIELVNNSFNRIDAVLEQLKIRKVNAILMDLGVSSHQIDKSDRGFSFMADGPLDMRMGADAELSAADVINQYSELKLTDIFRRYGEEKRAAVAAREICAARTRGKIETTSQLREILGRILSPRYLNASLARIFQAIRIEINQELDQLKETLPKALEYLSIGGRMAVISYHSLEDRTVKRFFTEEAKGCICPPKLPQCACGRMPTVKILTRKVVTPSDNEIKLNSRARSAKLRAVEKIA